MAALLFGTSAADTDRLPKILAPPVGPWPEGGMFSIRLCISYDGADACGDKEATPAQRRTIEQILWQMPQITGLRYENKQEALDDFLEASPNLIGVMKESDMPETFTGRLHRWSDAPAFNSALKKLPGIAVIHVIPTPLWEGTADMTIILCDNSRRWGPCERRGRATADERAAVGVLLRRMKGVKRIYFANQAHNMWMFKQFDTLLSHVINPAPRERTTVPIHWTSTTIATTSNLTIRCSSHRSATSGRPARSIWRGPGVCLVRLSRFLTCLIEKSVRAA